ncbi:response regulator [Aliivibrio kagoshimensis]|uniref:response regulator n=1 Tax=Aliivibrio kagoshimensis TaxID=2910230 RepID=UPI003D0D069B
MISLILADDHLLMQEGLKARLERETELSIVDCVGTGAEALAQTLRLQPDLILLDINMPEMTGIEVLEALKTGKSSTKVIILSMHDSQEFIVSAMRSGACGYVLKDVSSDDLIKAIHTVAEGGTYYSSVVSQRLLDSVTALQKEEVQQHLTQREEDVLSALANGDCNKNIARNLSISVRTVETHRLRIKRKLGVKSTAALVRVALDRGLVC